MEVICVDVRGEFCPVPIIMAQEAYASLTKNDNLVIITDDQTVLYNLLDWAETLGHELTPVKQSDNSWQIMITK